MTKLNVGDSVTLLPEPYLLGDNFTASDVFVIIEPDAKYPQNYNENRGVYRLRLTTGPRAGIEIYAHQAHVIPASKEGRLAAMRKQLSALRLKLESLMKRKELAESPAFWEVYGQEEEQLAKIVAGELGLNNHRKVLEVLRKHFDVRCY